MSKWPGATRKLARHILPALLILAGLLGIVLSVVQGGGAMTEPFTVHLTETPGVYCTNEGRYFFHVRLVSSRTCHCVRCSQILDVPSCEHWKGGNHYYCENCVVVADEGEGP